MNGFSGKVVVITGATSIVGAATAQLFAKHGATLVLNGVGQDDLKEISEQCVATGLNKDLVGDPTDDNVQVLNAAIQTFGRLDILVNASERAIPGSPLPGINMNDVKDMFDANVRAVVKICLEAVPHLKKTKGNIVNVSSSLGSKPVHNYLAYCVSKAGLDMFTKGLALELAPHGIRVNSVNPGMIYPSEDSENEELLKSMAAKSPLGRLAKADEIAEAILFLSSEKAGFVTGQLLAIDGGLSL